MLRHHTHGLSSEYVELIFTQSSLSGGDGRSSSRRTRSAVAPLESSDATARRAAIDIAPNFGPYVTWSLGCSSVNGIRQLTYIHLCEVISRALTV